ncbi:abortive infection family protein [Epibacterium ulvae]|uniref:abortive infection family protein n=1 Tax=Epibacterium ulvae TaxID=1156985 RepID=UPI00249387D9|nr:abortive infection family protein [Epibacterium ulvae]
MTEKNTIPRPVVSVLAKEFSSLFTHTEINRFFSYADAPGEEPEGNKEQKTIEWLNRINNKCTDPLLALGLLLEDLFEREFEEKPSIFHFGEVSYEDKLQKGRDRISQALQKKGLRYIDGGLVSKSSSVATQSLIDRVRDQGLGAVEIEIQRALSFVSDDANGAAQFACNVLEAVFKHYLIARSIPFNQEKDGINELWKLVRDDMGANPKDLTRNDLKKIASGMGSIVDGTMHVRNKKSGAHGRTEQQIAALKLQPRHARLVVHSSHTLAIYVLECLDER